MPTFDDPTFAEHVDARFAATMVPWAELDAGGSDRSHCWPRADALALVASLAGRPVAVLGGDVLEAALGGGGYRYTHDNWCCEPRRGEDAASFAGRSQAAAARYVASHHERRGRRTIYSLVIAARADGGGTSGPAGHDQPPQRTGAAGIVASIRKLLGCGPGR